VLETLNTHVIELVIHGDSDHYGNELRISSLEIGANPDLDELWPFSSSSVLPQGP